MGFNIAVVPGDGIGKEVMPEGIRAVNVACRELNIDISWQWFDWSCET